MDQTPKKKTQRKTGGGGDVSDQVRDSGEQAATPSAASVEATSSGPGSSSSTAAPAADFAELQDLVLDDAEVNPNTNQGPFYYTLVLKRPCSIDISVQVKLYAVGSDGSLSYVRDLKSEPVLAKQKGHSIPETATKADNTALPDGTYLVVAAQGGGLIQKTAVLRVKATAASKSIFETPVYTPIVDLTVHQPPAGPDDPLKGFAAGQSGRSVRTGQRYHFTVMTEKVNLWDSTPTHNIEVSMALISNKTGLPVDRWIIMLRKGHASVTDSRPAKVDGHGSNLDVGTYTLMAMRARALFNEDPVTVEFLVRPKDEIS